MSPLVIKPAYNDPLAEEHIQDTDAARAAAKKVTSESLVVRNPTVRCYLSPDPDGGHGGTLFSANIPGEEWPASVPSVGAKDAFSLLWGLSGHFRGKGQAFSIAGHR